MADTGSLHIDITPKIRKVTAHVDLYVDGRVVGSTEVDLTPDMLTRPIAIPDWASGVEVKYEGKGGPGGANGIPGMTGTNLSGYTINVTNERVGDGLINVDSIKAAQAAGKAAR